MRTTPEADEDIRRVDGWWREHRPAAPDLFVNELAVILLRRFYIKNRQGVAPHQGWIVVRAVKEGNRMRYEAEPWWEGLRGGEKAKAQTSPEKAVEEGYRLLERLWEREFKYAPKVVRLRSEYLG